MARNVRKKLIYKDRATGKLIPKKLADQRDPSTWVEEEFILEVDDADDSVKAEPPLLTQSV
jgi:hypothetical protein